VVRDFGGEVGVHGLRLLGDETLNHVLEWDTASPDDKNSEVDILTGILPLRNGLYGVRLSQKNFKEISSFKIALWSNIRAYSVLLQA